MTPGTAVVPEWVQLLGLSLLMTAPVLRLACWRRMIADGVKSSELSASTRLREQRRDEGRVRFGAALIVGATVLLMPVPPTWVEFWFALAVVTTSLALITLTTRDRRSPARPRARCHQSGESPTALTCRMTSA
ncbi:hypothetical protein [Nocardia fluminea]|uniref:hypothetical protein n=1 Tax=Nocardia fluminea TaxID=134984 RepID=UPI0036545FE0